MLNREAVEDGGYMSEEQRQVADEAQETGTVEIAVLSADECLAKLQELRFGMLPMLEAAKAEYENRVRPGYPTLTDNVERGGVFGLNLDPGFGLYFMTDGESVYAEIHRVFLRTDTLSSANYEKFSGRPIQDRHELDFNANTLRQGRNLLSQLLNHWATQQTFVYRVDS